MIHANSTPGAAMPLIDLSRLPSIQPADWTPVDQPVVAAQASADALLEGLNEQQRAAVLHTGGPLLIVAGAGSGKTRVLAHRIAYNLAVGRILPSQVLAITFTNKAAAEMRERVADLVGPPARRMWVTTFHSACVRILRAEHHVLNLPSSFTIYDAADSQRLIGLVAQGEDLDPKRYPIKGLARRISALKNELIDPDDFSSKASLSEWDDVVRRVYPAYQRRLRLAKALDFDDLIMETVGLLQAFPAVAQNYRQRFQQIFVDEYQDTNHAQYVLVRELCGVPARQADSSPEGAGQLADLTVVGDADQSIYAFRGASIRNIREFEDDFPEATTILLEQNYRSTQCILSAANAVIAKNPDRVPKRLWTAGGDGEKVVGYAADHETDEARFIAEEIDRLIDEQIAQPYDVAVFYRVNAQSRALEEQLIRLGIPYRVVGGTRFYDRREIRDAIAYLRCIDNPDDTVSLRRIFNVPRRGLGDRTEALFAQFAERQGISFGAALRQDVPGVAPRAAKAVEQLVRLLDEMAAASQAGAGPAELLQEVLEGSGYLAELNASKDLVDLGRAENLAELRAVALEFERTAPTGSLADFLERVALVADSDQLPVEDSGCGQVTLMTLHTAKGLEFPVVFLTGLEDGTLPHARSLSEPRELEEERRLAYVGLTRARMRLYLTRAAVRTTWGRSQDYAPSRFLADIPEDVLQWRRERANVEQLRLGAGSQSSRWSGWSSSRSANRNGFVASGFAKPGKDRSSAISSTAAEPGATGAGATAQPGMRVAKLRQNIPELAAGDRIKHEVYGEGVVSAIEGSGPSTVARVAFPNEGIKRLILRFAPITKL
ncbi:MAG: UvrD-helicase domain-containing protein [Bifidobacteriaceae bacterium]|jgi:DNA helicase-2/ATP-dependent DNA helicase PcrA|nr:UvrD-helicase domain-containing protein [Bifidobacteriaceae bacterium]